VRVALTRDEDRYVVHAERYGMASVWEPELFISVHADAAPANDLARGATIYTLSEVASDRQAALLAAQENKSDLIAGVETAGQDETVSRILIDLAQRESMDASAALRSSCVGKHRPSSRSARDITNSLFAGAEGSRHPSILFESGYLTNAEDAAYIQSSEGQQQIATGCGAQSKPILRGA
jgi:N-acetylmuramoyl-L-alanine amidase